MEFPSKRLWKRWWFWLTASVFVAVMGLLVFCWTRGVWSLNEWRVYQAMDRECHPVWRDFHHRRVRAGDAVDEVIARTQPVSVERSGRWVVLRYHGGGLCFTGITAAAYDGQMVAAFAWSCAWGRQFFDIMSEDQRKAFFGGFDDQPAAVGNAIVVR